MDKQNILKKYANNIAKKIILSKTNHQYFMRPFKHLIVNNILEKNFAKNCKNSFPDLKDKIWEKSNLEKIEIKFRSTWKSEFDIPPNLISLVRILNSSIILRALSIKFKIPKLIPDPYFSGGGLNVTEKGGLLDVHVDGNYHDASGLNRRINILIYFNLGWKKNWGGEFGLYSKNGKKCLKKISPIFNRLIAFDTHDYSMHGLPNPINFPKNNPRKSLILYYYTKNQRPKSLSRTNKPHSALWLKKKIKDKRGKLLRNYS
jgi:Rps23 Pro-64 3,4-dihydroxylase Tpa1-like proline 4-hydroxylase